MNQRTKRILSLLLVITMLFGMLVFPVGAAESGTPAEEPTEAPAEGSTEAPAEESTPITGDGIITAEGVYRLAEEMSGTIVVATTEPVTIIGSGAQWDETCTMTTAPNSGLYIDCTSQAGVNLTLQDVYIQNNTSVVGENGEGFGLIGFTGTGNTLNFEGVSVLEYQIGGGSNPGGIHVKQGDALTIGGSGTVYFYKSAQGAGIGGSSGEVNGDITFAMDGTLFAKGTKQGALIGAGSGSAGVEGAPGAISFVSGAYNLISNSRGAAIGGSAGSTGGSSGTTVNVGPAANININVDYSGAAVGGGGYVRGNDASGGTLVVNGGSLRTYIDSNAANNATIGWNGKPFAAGINDAAITAQRVNGNGEAVYIMAFDTTQLTEAASAFEVYVDDSGELFYQGSLPEYSYVQEGLDKDQQMVITSTPSNWYRSGETNLYFYLTGEDHILTVNGETFTYYWDELSQTFDTVKKANVTFFVDAENAEIVLSDGIGYTYLENTHDGYFFNAVEADEENGAAAEAAKTMFSLAPGEYTFTITCDGYYASTGSFKVSGDTHAVSIETTSNINSYLKDDLFTIPMTAFARSTNENAWDGVTLDVSWYDENAAELHIATPAQLAGMAAIVNGIYNAETTAIIDDVNGDGVTETYTPYDYARLENRKIIAASSTGSTGSNNQVTTLSYWYGAKSRGTFTSDGGELPLPADFSGQTVYIDNDLDMGGYQVDGIWTGARYMTIGGQSLMHYIDYSAWMSDGYSHIGSSFNGTLDGQGHIVKNMYCDRYATGSNYGDSVSVGLVGRLGAHDSDPAAITADAPAARNIAVTGYVYGRRSVGGIVGKTGKATGGAGIENCVNFARVVNTDAKGVGGICGAGWNKGTIRNCANFGSVYAGRQNGGGICGTCELPVINCYNVGYVDAISYTQGQAIGTDNGGAVYTNVYWLTGSSIADSVDTYSYPAVFRHDSKDTITEVESFDGFKTADFLANLNGEFREWVFVSENDAISAVLSGVSFKNCRLDTTGVTAAGFPVPRCFITDTTTVTAVEKTADPEKLAYVEGQSFDPAGLEIVATWSDGTSEILTDYAVSPDRPLELDDSAVTVYGAKGGVNYSFDFTITVVENELNTLEITTKPSNTLYAQGETFNPSGMVVKAAYTVDPTTKVTLDASEYTYTVEGNLVTVSYTFKEKTLTAAVELTILDTPAPGVNESGAYALYNSNDVLWFANRVKAYKLTGLNAVVMNDITVDEAFSGIGSSGVKYAGTFDGENHTLTLNMTSSGSAGLFAYVDGAVIRNVTVAGSVTSTSGNAGIAGIVGYVYDRGAVIENCVNKAAVSSAGYTGGIVGKTYGSALTISGCVNEGTITGTGNYAGGIAAYLVGTGSAESPAAVVSCMNDGNVSSTGCYVGGIAGYTKSVVHITRCGNTGTVSGKYDVGGILGYSADAGDLVSSCYNAASVTATGAGANHGVGGIVGCGLGNVQNVYNLGSVTSEAGSASATFGVGGVIGTIGNHAVSTNGMINVYNAGNVTGSGNARVGALAGYIRYTSVMTNCHYLEGTADTPYGAVSGTYTVEGEAAVQTEATLKELAGTLGAEFKADSFGGYPVLVWQNVCTVTLPADGEGYTVAAAEGYATTVEKGGEFKFSVELRENYHIASVRAGNRELTAADGIYTIENILEDVIVSIDVFHADAMGTCGNLEWLLSRGVLTISGEGQMKVFSNKTAMPWYEYLDQISAVVIEEGVTSISDYAFYGMPLLKTISIPGSVTAIGNYAFKNSTALDGVVLPANLTQLGESAFYGCTGLTAIDIPASLWTVKPYTFKNCTSLAEVTFHEGNLMKICDAAFYNTALTRVELPDCLDILDVYVFKNCAALAEVRLSGSMTEIREAAFYGTVIPGIEIPEGITKIGPYAFKNCTALESVSMPESLMAIGESAFFGCTGITRLTIPGGVSTIGGYAFKRCSALSEVDLPASLTDIGDSAFHSCTALLSVSMPAHVEAVGAYCFSSSALAEIIFTGSAPAIGTGTFNKVTATAFYPASDVTWTADVMGGYGGTITWIAR